jgi:uncharacterized protein YggE
MRSAAFALAAVLLVGFAGAASGGSTAAPGGGARTITVTGTGIVSAVPNRAQFSFGVTSVAKTATQALAGNAADMQKVIAALKSAGIAAKDLQTQNVSLDPRYSDNGDEILGYTATNSVSARVSSLGRAGQIIDAAVGAGANQVSGPSLTRSDSAGLYRQALRAAVENARLKARSAAAGAHVRLGRIRSIVEGSAAPQPVPFAAAPKAADSTPIEAGTQLIEADVTVEFAIA